LHRESYHCGWFMDCKEEVNRRALFVTSRTRLDDTDSQYSQKTIEILINVLASIKDLTGKDDYLLILRYHDTIGPT
jgi:hypothetical protein